MVWKRKMFGFCTEVPPPLFGERRKGGEAFTNRIKLSP
jgi:hypothetical protein